MNFSQLREIKNNLIPNIEIKDTCDKQISPNNNNRIEIISDKSISLNNAKNYTDINPNVDQENNISLINELRNDFNKSDEVKNDSFNKIIPVRRNTKSFEKDKLKLASENQRLIRENGCTKLKYRPEQFKTMNQFKEMLEKRKNRDKDLNIEHDILISSIGTKSELDNNDIISQSKSKPIDTNDIAPLRNRIRVDQNSSHLLNKLSVDSVNISKISTSVDLILKEKYKNNSNFIELKSKEKYEEEKEQSENFLQRLKINLLNSYPIIHKINKRSGTAEHPIQSTDHRVRCVKTAGEIDPILSEGVELILNDEDRKTWMNMTPRDKWKKHRNLLLLAENEKHKAVREQRLKKMNLGIEKKDLEDRVAQHQGDDLSSDDYEWTLDNDKDAFDDLDSSCFDENDGDDDSDREFGRVKTKTLMNLISDDEENENSLNQEVQSNPETVSHSFVDLFDNNVNFFDIPAIDSNITNVNLFSNTLEKNLETESFDTVPKTLVNQELSFLESTDLTMAISNQFADTLVMPNSDQHPSNSFQQHLIRRKLFSSESEEEPIKSYDENESFDKMMKDNDKSNVDKLIDIDDVNLEDSDEEIENDKPDMNSYTNDEINKKSVIPVKVSHSSEDKKEEQEDEIEKSESQEGDEVEEENESQEGDEVEEENESQEEDEVEENESQEEDDEEELLRREVIGGPDNSKSSTKFQPNEYFDDEAELSGDDADQFGSDEEEEHGVDLDKYEEDEGEAEKLPSEGRLRRQVERIHNRMAIDEDAQNLRYLKELYLEDGDLHLGDRGPRKKRFGWAGLNDNDDDDDRIKIDDQNNVDNDDLNDFEIHDFQLMSNQFQQNDVKGSDEEREFSSVTPFHIYKPSLHGRSISNVNDICSAWKIDEQKIEGQQPRLLSNTKKYGSFIGKRMPICQNDLIGKHESKNLSESSVNYSNEDLKWRMQQHTFSVISRDKRNFDPSKNDSLNGPALKKRK